MNRPSNSTTYLTVRTTLCGITRKFCSVRSTGEVQSLSSGVGRHDISLGLTKLHIIPNKTSVTSSYYINEILEKDVKPAFQRTSVCAQLIATKMFHNNGEGFFQQDGARAHTSKASVEWLNKNITGYISPGTGHLIRRICQHRLEAVIKSKVNIIKY